MMNQKSERGVRSGKLFNILREPFLLVTKQLSDIEVEIRAKVLFGTFVIWLILPRRWRAKEISSKAGKSPDDRI